MLLVRFQPPEGFTAYLAREWPHARVYPHVFLEGVVVAEGLSAYLAEGTLLPQMQEIGLLEGLRGGQYALADLAGKRALIVRVGEVLLQSEAVAVGLAAYVADGLAFVAVYALEVHIQVALHLELPAAGLAGEPEALGVLAHEVLAQRLPALKHAFALAADVLGHRLMRL